MQILKYTQLSGGEREEKNIKVYVPVNLCITNVNIEWSKKWFSPYAIDNW